MEDTRAARLRADLADLLRAQKVIRTAPVGTAMAAVPRHRFVPGVSLETAYAPDDAVVTRQDADGAALSSASAPRVVAAMLEQLDVQPGHRILEIGAGTGYNAALLSHLTGLTGAVTTIDLDQDIVDGARQALEASGRGDVRPRRRPLRPDHRDRRRLGPAARLAEPARPGRQARRSAAHPQQYDPVHRLRPRRHPPGQPVHGPLRVRPHARHRVPHRTSGWHSPPPASADSSPSPGPTAGPLHQALTDQILIWGRDHATGPGPRIEVHPAGQAPTAGQIIIGKKQTSLAISWPATISPTVSWSRTAEPGAGRGRGR